MRSLGTMFVAGLVLYSLDSVWFYGAYFRTAKTIAFQLWLHFVG
jgi:hypothetical protein